MTTTELTTLQVLQEQLVVSQSQLSEQSAQWAITQNRLQTNIDGLTQKIATLTAAQSGAGQPENPNGGTGS